METTATTYHRRPEVHQILPDFNLRTPDGKLVSPLNYKPHKALVLFFMNPRNSDDLATIAEIACRYYEFEAANAELVAIATGPMEELRTCAEALHPPFPLLVDESMQTRKAYGVESSTFFVADRFGELRLVVESKGDTDANLKAVLDTLELLELECPECGAPTWYA